MEEVKNENFIDIKNVNYTRRIMVKGENVEQFGKILAESGTKVGFVLKMHSFSRNRGVIEFDGVVRTQQILNFMTDQDMVGKYELVISKQTNRMMGIKFLQLSYQDLDEKEADFECIEKGHHSIINMMTKNSLAEENDSDKGNRNENEIVEEDSNQLKKFSEQYTETDDQKMDNGLESEETISSQGLNNQYLNKIAINYGEGGKQKKPNKKKRDNSFLEDMITISSSQLLGKEKEKRKLSKENHKKIFKNQIASSFETEESIVSQNSDNTKNTLFCLMSGILFKNKYTSYPEFVDEIRKRFSGYKQGVAALILIDPQFQQKFKDIIQLNKDLTNLQGKEVDSSLHSKDTQNSSQNNTSFFSDYSANDTTNQSYNNGQYFSFINKDTPSSLQTRDSQSEEVSKSHQNSPNRSQTKVLQNDGQQRIQMRNKQAIGNYVCRQQKGQVIKNQCKNNKLQTSLSPLRRGDANCQKFDCETNSNTYTNLESNP